MAVAFTALGGIVGELGMDLMVLKRAELIGVTLRTRGPEQRAAIVRAMREDLGHSLEQLRPSIGRIMLWDDIEDAHALLKRGGPVGKLVLKIA